MRPGVLFPILLLCLGLVAWVYSRYDVAVDTGPVGAAEDAAGPAAAELRVGGASDDSATDRRPADVPPDVGDVTTDAAPQTWLTGRCVDPDSKSPLPGVEARVGSMASVSGADGRFRFDLTGRETHHYVVQLLHPQRLGAENHVVFPKHTSHDLGDVPLPPGTALRGRVERVGGGIADVLSMRIGRRGFQRTKPGWSEFTSLEVEPNARGEFEMPSAVPPGTYQLFVPHVGAYEPHTVVIEAGGAPSFVTVSVAQRPAAQRIAGVVVDESGAPVPGIGLHLTQGNETGRRQSLATIPTSRRGRFVFERKRAAWGEAPCFLECASTARHLRFASGPLSFGTHGVRVELRPHAAQPEARITIRVLDADGKPVLRFQPKLDLWTNDFLRSHRRELGFGPHTGGRYEFTGLAPGRYGLEVESGQARDCGVSRILEAPRDFGREIEVRLPRMVPVKAVVRDDAGAPVAGALVRFDGEGTHRFASQARTDSAGEAELQHPAADVAVRLGVYPSGARHERIWEQRYPIAAHADTLEFTLHSMRASKGAVGPGQVWERLCRGRPARERPRLQFHTAKGSQILVVQPDAAGAFECEGALLEARYAVQLLLTPTGGTGDIHVPLADLQARRGQDVHIDLGGARFGTLTAEVRLEGEPFAAAQLAWAYHLSRGGQRQRRPVSFGTLRTDDRGVARIDPAPPGRYVFYVGGGTAEVEYAGGEVTETLKLTRRTLILRLCDADGHPLRGRREVRTSRWTRITDGDGRLKIHPAPTQPLKVYVGPRGPGQRELGPFQADAGELVTEVEVRLPR